MLLGFGFWGIEWQLPTTSTTGRFLEAVVKGPSRKARGIETAVRDGRLFLRLCGNGPSEKGAVGERGRRSNGPPCRTVPLRAVVRQDRLQDRCRVVELFWGRGPTCPAKCRFKAVPSAFERRGDVEKGPLVNGPFVRFLTAPCVRFLAAPSQKPSSMPRLGGARDDPLRGFKAAASRKSPSVRRRQE
ncbi:hypothetical protein M885DRAFT_290220 [Pelagophyceae sp. CCMP2097]|nr:hypothetical protein M885DRAFT_290220 [Pelagophyceae sp. CCMP2097]